MSVLAKAVPAELRAAIEGVARIIEAQSDCETVRPAEIGPVMARARAGGTGQRFNLGEVTVTRCAVRSAKGHVGIAYIRGRDKGHAELAALVDALLQDDVLQDELLEDLIEPLARLQEARHEQLKRKAAATRVEFFTMPRGQS